MLNTLWHIGVFVFATFGAAIAVALLIGWLFERFRDW